MADKSFGVKQLNLIGASGTPNITSPNNLNLNATTVAVSTDISIGGQVSSNIIVGSVYSVGIGTTNPKSKLHILGNALIAGVVTASLFDGNLIGNSTYASTAGIATYASTAGIATSVIGGIGSLTQLQVTGISTFGFFKEDRTLEQDYVLSEPNKIIYTIDKNINVVAGKVFTVGSGTTLILDRFNNTDDVVAQSLRVVNDITTPNKIGAGNISPRFSLEIGEIGTLKTSLWVNGNANFTGIITASSFQGNASTATYASTAGIATYASTAGIATYASTAGIATYASTAGIATYASTAGIATLSQGLTGTPNVIVGVITATDYRIRSVSEKTTLVSGNTVNLTYDTGGGNIVICTNPTGNITLNVNNIPVDTSFDNMSLTFSVIVSNTGIARSCTAVNLNGVSRTIKWFGGSLSTAIAGVTTSSGYDIYNFTCINVFGSASSMSNYEVLGSVNGGYR